MRVVNPNRRTDPATGIALLGMHRSGTSCLTGLLEEAGVYLGTVSKWNPHNLRGNQEHSAVVALNDDVLAANGASWDAPPPSTCVWTLDQLARRDSLLASYAGHEPWAFKDPRTLLTLEGWKSGYPQLAFIGTFRHPFAVARSLQARNQGSLERWLGLWLAYNRRLLELRETESVPLVCFDSSPATYLAQFRRAVALHGVVAPNYPKFFDQNLRTQTGEAIASAGLGKECLQVYAALRYLVET